jgi:hypothetical protein
LLSHFQIDGAPWPCASGGGYANHDRPSIAKLLRLLQRSLIKAGEPLIHFSRFGRGSALPL